jgi:hypothetical protein
MQLTFSYLAEEKLFPPFYSGLIIAWFVETKNNNYESNSIGFFRQR